MESVILVVHLIMALSIIAVVLVQPSESGGFLGSSGSMSNMMAPRRKGDALTRVTGILAGIFFMTSLSLAIMAEHRAPAKSILDIPTDSVTPPPAAEKTAPPPDASDLKTVAPAKTAAPAPQKKKPAAPISK